MVRNSILRLALSGVVLGVGTLAGSSAKAALILEGNSNGSTLSDCLSCIFPGTTSSNLVLPTNSRDKTILAIDPISFSASGSTTGLMLAELNLDNGNKPSTGQFSFKYNLLLTFILPAGSDSRTFGLSISGNGKSGSNALEQLSGFPASLLPSSLVLGDVSLSNFHFAIGATSAGGSFDSTSGTWSLTGTGTSTLDLLADVTYTPPPPPHTDLPPNTNPLSNPNPSGVTQVPEPSSLVLLGGSLLGMWLTRRRFKAA
jgi:hypothetical protein